MLGSLALLVAGVLIFIGCSALFGSAAAAGSATLASCFYFAIGKRYVDYVRGFSAGAYQRLFEKLFLPVAAVLAGPAFEVALGTSIVNRDAALAPLMLVAAGFVLAIAGGHLGTWLRGLTHALRGDRPDPLVLADPPQSHWDLCVYSGTLYGFLILTVLAAVVRS